MYWTIEIKKIYYFFKIPEFATLQKPYHGICLLMEGYGKRVRGGKTAAGVT